MPILIKDNIETAGPLPTTAGSLALADNVTNRDAPLVARLRAAGAVIVGKANLREWANIRSTTIRSRAGARSAARPAIPMRSTATPAARSRGSGAAVAAGMVPAAIGTETDGSITCPAAINGIVGFKPTVGLVSRTHVVPISHSQDTPGPMTRTVRDAALVLNAIAGSDPADPADRARPMRRRADYAAGLAADALRGKRIGVMRFASGFGTDAAVRGGARTLRAQGAVLVEIAKFERKPEIGRNEFTVLLTELKADLNAYLATTAAGGADPHARRRDRLQHGACRRARWPCSARTLFEQAEATKGLDDPDYTNGARDRAAARRRRRASTSCCATTMSSPWSARPCRRPGRSTPSTATRSRAAAPAASPRSPAIRTSPCRWAQVKRAAGGPELHRPEMVGRADPVAGLCL